MNREEVLAIFDNGRRNPGGRWEIGDYFGRNASPEGALVGVYYSCFPPDKLSSIGNTSMARICIARTILPGSAQIPLRPK